MFFNAFVYVIYEAIQTIHPFHSVIALSPLLRKRLLV